MLKKPSGLLLSCNSWSGRHPTTAPPSRTSSLNVQAQQQRCRPYAIISDGHSRHDHAKLRWPELQSANAVPTPYQIFHLKKGAPYSKHRFYELVKLYHPDRHDLESSISSLSHETKVERYRLIIAANNILSDPVKRGAYDGYGAGWNGQSDVATPRDPSEYSHGREWGGRANGPYQNATWEDWERWYQRDAQGPQEPRFVSNSAFVGLILTFAVLGGIGQATRVGNYSMTFLEQRDALHDSVSKDLIRRRKETTSVGSHDERIDRFLRNRDASRHVVVDAKESTYRRLLPAPEICSSEDISGRRIEGFRGKEGTKGG